MGKPETGKPLVWLKGEVKTPPFSAEARIEAGYLLRLVQRGDTLTLPHSRPMPTVGPRCHELRINDAAGTSASCIGPIPMPSSFWRCSARKRHARRGRSSRHASVGSETTTG